jgi:hypothetical protein
MSRGNRELPVGFKGIVGIAGCVIGLAVVYFGYGIGTDSPEKAPPASAPAAQPERKRPIRAMNMALGNMVFFARDLGFHVKNGKDAGIDADRIAARIEGQLQEIRELYRQEIMKHPGLAGNLTVQFNIGTAGEVAQVRELASRLNDHNFKQAILAAVSKWSFGEISGPLLVTCPLLFVHEGMDITTLVQWEKTLGQAALESAAPARPPVQAASTHSPAPQLDAKEFQIKYATALRKEPSFSSPALASLSAGTKVHVMRRQGDWLEVRAAKNAPIGFVRREFVTTIEVARR